MDKEYEVGYGRPPLATRFQPGRSGNPTGKRKRPPSLPEIEARVLFAKERITINGKARKLPTAAAALTALKAKAFKGDVRAALAVLKRIDALAPKMKLDEPPDPHAERAQLLLQVMEKVFLGGPGTEETNQENQDEKAIPEETHDQ